MRLAQLDHVTTPRDVPSVRAGMVSFPSDSLYQAHPRLAGLVKHHQRTLKDSWLCWVDRQLMQEAVNPLRAALDGDTIIEASSTPAPHGLIVLERPEIGTCVDEESPTIPMGAVTWTTSDRMAEVPLKVEGTQMAALSREPGDDAFTLAIWAYSMSVGWFPTTAWAGKFGQSLFDGVGHDQTDPHVRSQVEDATFALALWDVLTEPEVADIKPYARSKAQRTAIANGTPPEVVIARLRGAHAETSGHHNGPGVRFYVRPHYRNQACGPGRTQRRRIVVPGHWKGPDGAPVRITDHVFAANRGG